MTIDKQKIKIIAEVGVNHNGKLSLAKKLISVAKKCGADYVKFQNWKAEDLVTKNAQTAKYQKINTGKNQSQFDLLKPLELKYSNYFELKKYANKIKIKFLSSPFDEKNFEFLISKIQLKLIKIPSGEINNFLMLNKIDLKKTKILLSTGMSTLKDITDAINFICKEKIFEFKNKSVIIKKKKRLKLLRDKIYILHCVTDYPVLKQYANLKAIKTLADSFKLQVGYSDHTTGIDAPLIAASLGAVFIEKHITLNKNLKGPDHKASLNPAEFRKMVTKIRDYEKMIGDGEKVPQKCEMKNMVVARKSVVARKNINIGEKFDLNNLTVKRPSGGINPALYFNYIGKKSKKNYKKDQQI